MSAPWSCTSAERGRDARRGQDRDRPRPGDGEHHQQTLLVKSQGLGHWKLHLSPGHMAQESDGRAVPPQPRRHDCRSRASRREQRGHIQQCQVSGSGLCIVVDDDDDDLCAHSIYRSDHDPEIAMDIARRCKNWRVFPGQKTSSNQPSQPKCREAECFL